MAKRVGYEYRLFLSNAGANDWTAATQEECIAVLLKRGLPERVHHKYMRQCVGVTVGGGEIAEFEVTEEAASAEEIAEKAETESEV